MIQTIANNAYFITKFLKFHLLFGIDKIVKFKTDFRFVHLHQKQNIP